MKLKVEFEVSVPEGVTFEQAEEWLLFLLGERGGIAAENPMTTTPLEARRVWVTNA